MFEIEGNQIPRFFLTASFQIFSGAGTAPRCFNTPAGGPSTDHLVRHGGSSWGAGCQQLKSARNDSGRRGQSVLQRCARSGWRKFPLPFLGECRCPPPGHQLEPNHRVTVGNAYNGRYLLIRGDGDRLPRAQIRGARHSTFPSALPLAGRLRSGYRRPAPRCSRITRSSSLPPSAELPTLA